MKSIFKLNIDISSVKGAISSISFLKEQVKDLKSDLGNITEDLLKNTPGGISALTKLRSGVDKLRGSVGSVTDKFKNMGMSVRGLATNAFSKLTSVLKTGMMAAGAVIGAVTALFNMANGTNRTVTAGALAGLSYAEQKALDDANEETGFNADFATNRAGFHQGSDTLAAKALLQNGVLNEGEFDSLKNDSRSYYKLNDKLYAEYKRIRENSADENTADEHFKEHYGSVLQQFGYGDFATFKLANQKGVIDRHKQTFADTHKAYSGVDVNALLKGERALNQFSETMKAFALGVAAKFLPGLTEGLKSLTGLFQKISKYATESGLLKEISDAVGSLVEMIVSAGEAVLGLISKLMGGSVTEYVKDVFGWTSSTFKGITSMIKGDKESRDKHFAEAEEKRDRMHGKLNEAAGNIVGAATSLITKDPETIQNAKNVTKGLGETLYRGVTTVGGAIADTAKAVIDNEGTALERLDQGKEKILENGKQRLGKMIEGSNKAVTNAIHLLMPVNIDGKHTQTLEYNLTQQLDNQGRAMSQMMERKR